MRFFHPLTVLLVLSFFIHSGFSPDEPLAESVVSRMERIRTGRNGTSGATAFFRHPHPGEKRPGVIYIHGRLVQQEGPQEAQKRGYDIRAFVNALADAGYAAMAPVYREEGVRVRNAVRQAIRYMQDRDDIDGDRIVIISFSRGGVHGLRAASSTPQLKGLVLMSPVFANQAETNGEAYQRLLDNLQVPVFLTLGAEEEATPIGIFVRDRFIPDMENRKKDFSYRLDYPGNHRWFWRVQEPYWSDVLAFLEKQLK